MELLPTDMGKTVEAGWEGGVEGRSSVLNMLSLRWLLHTHMNMESI